MERRSCATSSPVGASPSRAAELRGSSATRSSLPRFRAPPLTMRRALADLNTHEREARTTIALKGGASAPVFL